MQNSIIKEKKTLSASLHQQTNLEVCTVGSSIPYFHFSTQTLTLRSR